MNPLILGPITLLQPIWLLAAIVLLLLALKWNGHTASNSWKAVLSPRVFRFFISNPTNTSQANLLMFAACIVALCMTQPVLRHSQDDTWRHSIGWIAVVDVSRSMTLDDVAPYRLSAARQALADLSTHSGARPIAMIIYSGDAYLIVPPAFDKTLFNQHAAMLEYGIVDIDGSNLARALSLAGSVVSDSGLLSARVFVLSDTDGINKASVAAAAYLARQKHRVDVLVFGKANARETLSQTNVSLNLANDLAKAGGGQAIVANGFGVLDYSDLSLQSQASASTLAELKALVWEDQSHWILLLAIPLLLLQFNREFEE